MNVEVWRAAGSHLAIGLLVGGAGALQAETGNARIRSRSSACWGTSRRCSARSWAACCSRRVAALTAISYAASRRADPGIHQRGRAPGDLRPARWRIPRPRSRRAPRSPWSWCWSLEATLTHFIRDTVTDLERTDALSSSSPRSSCCPAAQRCGGAYGVLVPQRIWLLVVLITGIGWVGYAATPAAPGASRASRGWFRGRLRLPARRRSALWAWRCGARKRRGPPPSGCADGGVAALSMQDRAAHHDHDAVALRLTSAGRWRVFWSSRRCCWAGGRRRPSIEGDHPDARSSLLPALVIAGVISQGAALATWLEPRLRRVGGLRFAAAIGGSRPTPMRRRSPCRHAGAPERAKLAVTAIAAVEHRPGHQHALSKMTAALAGGGASSPD